MFIDLAALILAHSKPELAKQQGSVYQVWEDGEVTCQKCGDLLWRRTIHTLELGLEERAVDPSLFPHQHNGHGYIFTDLEGARAVRQAILSRPRSEAH